jgi:major membrane immunogen (membrane-anchored lipoprotein)
MSEDMVKKNHAFGVEFVFSELPNSKKFIKNVSNLIYREKNEQKPRSIELMEELLDLAKVNPKHTEFVFRAQKGASFKDFASYLEAQDNVIDFSKYKETRIESKPRDKNWASMNGDERKMANLEYGLQTEFGHIPGSDKYVEDVKSILLSKPNSKEKKALKLLEANIKFAKKDPKFAGVILSATVSSRCYYNAAKQCVASDEKQAKQQALINSKILGAKFR